jgi:hypothetical protein
MDTRSHAIMFVGLMMGAASDAHDDGRCDDHSSGVPVPGGSALGS